ncbi:HupE/UreJ family protein [Cohaesibacter celericrescens]|uniref:HupE/UreJ family protein n=1 Tax=Cohaesibacter celericrescens TaxID=2067669 RepID=A0A2N5XQ55_9HYPH|nr:HupE/UreJ family protein [Cohaesibacter celericrescens]PLW76623.1 hypothetical protein C0081_13820 [Cohaesibacter celericrescens]
MSTIRLHSHIATFLVAVCLLCGLTPSAKAHFTLGNNVRIVHVTPDSDGSGLRIFMRIPGPLAYGETLAQRTDPTDMLKAPFLKHQLIAAVPYYRLDKAAIEADKDGFARFLAQGYAFKANGHTTKAVPVRMGYHTQDLHPDFDTASTAQDALDDFEISNVANSTGTIFISEALFDLELHLPDAQIGETLSINSTMPKVQIPPGVTLENLIIDHRTTPVKSLQIAGQMQEEIVLDGSPLTALGNFIWQGIWHILIGLDHVLFVVCFALAAGISRSILWSVTGFTLGHSITLYLGSIGFVPHGNWFIPAVETAIALSILYAAFLVVLRQKKQAPTGLVFNLNLFAMTAIIGLIHGYGFSFVLGDLLGGDASQMILALIGFNIGVELGQLGIVLLVFAALWVSWQVHASLPKGLAYASALIAAGMSLLWCWDRLQLLSQLV